MAYREQDQPLYDERYEESMRAAADDFQISVDDMYLMTGVTRPERYRTE